ncbi:MAG: heat-inducible transcription repressor HrcA [Vicinamibacteraceae bacterium]|nr:heat-inducible transcription repressor HrcA [Vicinamibacteraceae bacterium]
MPTGGSKGPSRPVPTLSERNRRILGLLVRQYIECGEPISSLWLAGQAGIGVSSATVRNVLAQLEELGYLVQPHTSAGRVPTDLGYRTYVDGLLHGRRPSRLVPEVEARLRQAGTLDLVLENASHEVSRASHLVGFALAPASDQTTLKHVDFVLLDPSRVLMVIVAANGQVWNKVLALDDALTPTELQQAANYLNREFAGRPLSEIRAAIVERMREDRALYDTLIARALTLASATLEDLGPDAQIHVHGTPALLDAAPEADAVTMAALRTVLVMLEEKHRLVKILTEYIDGPGFTVVIGAEHSTPALRDFSLVASTTVENGQATTVGVLGPRRMKYSRTLTTVDSFARTLGRILDPGTEPTN